MRLSEAECFLMYMNIFLVQVHSYLHGHRGSEELSRGGSRDYCWMS